MCIRDRHLADEAMYLVKNSNRDSVAAANIGILADTVAGAEPLPDVDSEIDIGAHGHGEKRSLISPERVDRRREGA